MKKVKLIYILLLLNSIIHGTSLSAQTTIERLWQQPEDEVVRLKLETWRDWKFGVIIHWGPYSVWGVTESWTLCPEDEPWCQRRGPYAENYYEYVKQYEHLPAIFNPVNFNPTRWAKACKNAGMRYMVFTTRHHDGFCMYDSKYSNYKITAPFSAFSGHPLSNITLHIFNAFRSEGLGIGAYYSKPDWHHPDYWWPYFPPTDRNVNYDPAKYPEKWESFKNYVYHQVDELTSDYGPIDILWLDGGWVRPAASLTPETQPWLGKNQWIQDIGMDSLARIARNHQPSLLIVDRTVHGPYENYLTPEQQIPNEPLPYPWESCITLGDSWYSTGKGDNFKSTQWIIHTLVKIVARGGNLLLGIGPDKTGDFPEMVYERLAQTGQWLHRFGEAIYATHPCEPYHEGSWYFTCNSNGYQYAILLKNEGEALPNRLILPKAWANTEGQIRIPGLSKTYKPKIFSNEKYIELSQSELNALQKLPALVLCRKTNHQ